MPPELARGSLPNGFKTSDNNLDMQLEQKSLTFDFNIGQGMDQGQRVSVCKVQNRDLHFLQDYVSILFKYVIFACCFHSVRSLKDLLIKYRRARYDEKVSAQPPWLLFKGPPMDALEL
jgi:hypothetical protein